MNSINEIGIQNMQDAWTILYRNIMNNILREKGKDGEIVIRRANHLCGERMGLAKKEQLAEKNKLANLRTLFSPDEDVCIDPRFRIEWQLFSEEEAVCDVITCPIYDSFEKAGERDLLLSFCEEFHNGYVMGFTNHAGQCILSENFRYEGENSCRIGCYYRPANLPKELRPSAFGCPSITGQELPGRYKINPNYPKFYSMWATCLLEAYEDECKARYGENSLWLLSTGIKNAAKETCEFLRHRSVHLRHEYNEEFLRENTLWLCPGIELQAKYPVTEKLIAINYQAVMKNDLKAK